MISEIPERLYLEALPSNARWMTVAAISTCLPRACLEDEAMRGVNADPQVYGLDLIQLIDQSYLHLLNFVLSCTIQPTSYRLQFRHFSPINPLPQNNLVSKVDRKRGKNDT